MKFDEAIEQMKGLHERAGKGVYRTNGTIYEPAFTPWELESEFLNYVDGILDELQDEYAPTIEMTQKQKEDVFGAATGDTTIDNVGKYDFEWASQETKLTDIQIMTAWLHPETIKVVDDDV